MGTSQPLNATSRRALVFNYSFQNVEMLINQRIRLHLRLTQICTNLPPKSKLFLMWSFCTRPQHSQPSNAQTPNSKHDLHDLFSRIRNLPFKCNFEPPCTQAQVKNEAADLRVSDGCTWLCHQYSNTKTQFSGEELPCQLASRTAQCSELL